MAEIDGYKVNENTFKTIDSKLFINKGGKKLSKYFIPFLYLLEQNSIKLVKLIKLLKLNHEIESKFNNIISDEYLHDK